MVMHFLDINTLQYKNEVFPNEPKVQALTGWNREAEVEIKIDLQKNLTNSKK